MKNSYQIATHVLIALAAALSSVGCAKDRSAADGRWVKAAPTSAAATGYVVELGPDSKEQVGRVLEEKGAKARVLSEKDGVYEIYGLAPEAITAALPAAAPRKNVYVADLIGSGTQARVEALAAQARGAVTAGAQQIPFLANCQQAISQNAVPTFDVRATNHLAQFSSSHILDLGDSLANFELVGPGLDFHWEAVGPNGFHLSGDGTHVSILAQLPGEYAVFVAAKNVLNVCSSVVVNFGVTWDAPYHGNRAVRAATADGFKAMGHLNAISAYAAWGKSRGRNARIAVLDTGVNYNHPDLSPNILTNTAPLANDFVGWDFVMGDGMPLDDNGHGSHVAGLAAGALYGVAPQASILPVKVLNAMGGGDAATIAQGIRYAVDRGVDVIVMSLGRDDASFRSLLQPALDYAQSRNVLVVAAAGNSSSNNDTKPFYPAAFRNPNLLTVAATTLEGSLEEYSNFGQQSVHIAAPGGDRDETNGGLWGPDYLSENYVRKSGTSMAAPVTAGVAALVKSVNPLLAGASLRSELVRTATIKPLLFGRTSSAAIVNAVAAVDGAQAASGLTM